jgi:copper oxidase (laccase) domain-containing protein
MTFETPALTARNLSLPGLRHAFFTRGGGVSEGVYASLNGGVGSRDAPPHVEENRARMAARLGVAAERLLVPFQIHSAEARAVREPWSADARPRCDGVATEVSLALRRPGADCGMLLFADAKAETRHRRVTPAGRR